MILLHKLQVDGTSMEPTFKRGDLILVSGLPYLFSRPKVNDLVVFKHEGGLLVKRISKISSGNYFVTSDNKKHGMDSRVFGWLSKAQLLGRVIYSSS